MDKEGKVLEFKSKQEIALQKIERNEERKKQYREKIRQQQKASALRQLETAKKKIEGGDYSCLVIIVQQPMEPPELMFSVDSDTPRTQVIGMLESVKFELFNLFPPSPPKSPKGA